ncbi:MAG: serine dehydratase subunit alpha family protein, partial [Ruminococcus sp.]
IPDRVEIEVSRNIIKNVKSVIVPHTGGLRGIEAAAAIGIIAGNAKRQLEVISSVTEQEIEETRKYLEETALHVDFSKSPLIFDIGITVFHGEEQAYVRIVDYHTNVVTIRHNDQTILSAEITGRTETSMADKSTLTIRDICEFAEIVKIKDVQEVLDRQVSYNMAIATEGIQNSYGANIGRVLLHTYGENDVKIRAKAMAAAGSDARMNGCELPVVINSGSGNQGITVSVPVVVYAKALNVSEEELYRALVVSNLSTLHIKEGIGRLSAYCGAVGAGCGAGAGIAWLHGGRYKEIAHTLVNSLAILSGTICDGAKASCAAKIAAAVDAGILGYFMYKDGQQFIDGDGIVKKDVENTIRCVGLLASEGMQETDKEIVHLMISKEVCQ